MIKIHKSKNGQYYFTVHAKNGAVLVTSEMYTRKKGCREGVHVLEQVFTDWLHSVDEPIDLTLK